uniref:Origin recognition complex subunit 4 n=1 Tax=Timema tahoe TaxID=61484 RepID=A0A7R9IA66_9NEOP|nr:unnamed protein product [Timema tahoe]
MRISSKIAMYQIIGKTVPNCWSWLGGNSYLLPVSLAACLAGMCYIMDKILSPNQTFRGFVAEKTHVMDLLKRTARFGESNSALIVGPRGSGKTTLVRTVLKELQELGTFDEHAILVQLDGRLHTDDRLAIKDITKQMKLEELMDDKIFMSFAENLAYLLQCLKSGHKGHSKSIIFVLEEFDLFCGHHNQTLLYNLFDIAQSAQAPICVVGVTARLDVTELLEKRVKSRFSHRQVFLFPPADKKVGFKSRLTLLEKLLLLPVTEPLEPVYVHCWNEHVLSIVANPEVRHVCKRLYDSDQSERTFRTFLAQIISKLDIDHMTLEASDFTSTFTAFFRDTMVDILTGLSVLEICLVIAMKHQTEIYDGDPLNFEMVLQRYLKFVSQNSSAETVQRPVLLKAFEHLKSLEIITPIGKTHREIQKEYQLHRFLVTSDQVNEAVKKFPGLPTDRRDTTQIDFELQACTNLHLQQKMRASNP